MFCTNCGKDCGEFKFCPHCGTKLQAPSEKPAWSVGKPCPQCGGTEIKDGHCAFCGVRLVEVQPARRTVELEEVSSEIPCGFYKAICGSLTLYEKDFLVTAVPLFKKFETRIPYDKITAVAYERYILGTYDAGHVTIRWEGNKDVPIPESGRLPGDKTRIAVAAHMDTLFYHIFCMLKALAPPTATFRLTTPPVKIPDLEALAETIDLEPYFDKYAPHRSQAVDEVCKRHGISKDAATVLIDRVFDARQKEIYEANPMAAIWDLNLVVGRKTKMDIQAAKERAEKRERIKRDALLYELERHGR